MLTADRKPYEISDIVDRLRTRFAWGLLADIEPPELEVRLAILRKKAAVESVPLPDDAAMYIATSIKANVRELEGALIRLAAYASLSKERIDLDFAKETLGAEITRPREIITVDGVIKAVTSYYGLKPSDIKSERRHKSVATPRAVAMYISRHHTRIRTRSRSRRRTTTRPRSRAARSTGHRSKMRSATRWTRHDADLHAALATATPE